jgi:ferredoxin
MATKVPVIDTEACIACGNCEAVCPDVFRLNESLGHSEVINPTGAPEDQIQLAIDQCPVQCITWQEAAD